MKPNYSYELNQFLWKEFKLLTEGSMTYQEKEYFKKMEISSFKTCTKFSLNVLFVVFMQFYKIFIPFLRNDSI